MWTEKQQEAIDKRNCNILVAASAGSGKTAVLVERVITRVITDGVDINKLLIVTFTNASASELKERLLKRIYEALDNDVSNAFLKKQIKNINIADIETIHSFCLKLIRSNFNVLEIDPNVSVCDESYSSVLKLKAINKVLENLYIEANNDDLKKEKLFKVLELFSSKDDNLISYILKIYSYINSFSYPLDTLKANIEAYNIDEAKIDLTDTNYGKVIFDDVLSTISLLIVDFEEKINKIRGKEDFEKIVDVLNSDITYLKSIVSAASTWDKLYDMLIDLSFSRMPTYKGVETELKDDIVDFRNKILKKQIEELKRKVYASSEVILQDNNVAYSYISYIYDIIVEFDKEYKKLKEESGVIDFSDIEHLALNVLVKKDEEGNMCLTDVAKALKDKFEEIYTDEYQDTSLVQEAILNAVSKDNNRFMVGDVKQSIYKFRQAMPEIFNSKYKEYTLNSSDNTDSNVKILLSKNFRSRENVVYSINEIYEKIMSDEVGSCNYADIEKLEFGAEYYKKDKSNDYRTEINIIDLKDEEKLSEDISEEEITDVDEKIDELKNFEIEAYFISKKIKDVINNFKVYDAKQDMFRKTDFKDIVILIRSIKDKGEILEKVLKESGIPAFSDSSSSIFETDEIKLVLSLLRIIDNPLQDIYMVSVMYSILGNFTLDELTFIRSYAPKKSIYDSLYIAKDVIQEEKKQGILTDKKEILLNKIIRLTTFLEQYISISKIYSVSQILLKLYKETNLYNQYLLEEDVSSIKRANLDYLIDIAINYENSFYDSNISSYIKYVDNLKEKADSSSSSAKILGENEDVVRIMTIHKSKGLEFPVVILSDTSRKYNIRDISNTVVMDNDLGIGINVVKEDLNITYPSVIKQAIKSKIEKDTKSEELRMLYVALTRAKEKLIIFSTLKDYEKSISGKKYSLRNGKIDPKIIEKNNSYYANIEAALMCTSKKRLDELFNINVLSKKDIKDMLNTKSEIEQRSNLKSRIEKTDNSENKGKIIDIIEKNLDFKYKYLDDTLSETRVSVSKLKEKSNEKNEETISFSMPTCLNDDIDTGASYGTLIHNILMYIDYTKINSYDDLKEFVNDLENNKVIKKESITLNMLNRINTFLNSNIGKELKKSIEIHKEKEFILRDKSVSNSDIQGVIDLYYINEKGNIILVDFKTDNLEKEAEFISRYKIQLEIYKRALEKLINKKVEKSYIYSFKLGKEIEVDCE